MRRFVLIGVGGASCSGKTTLAKHLCAVLPNSFILHQDDFWPAPEDSNCPISFGMPNWDAPPTAVDWPRMIQFLKDIRASGGQMPGDHKTGEYWNDKMPLPVPPGLHDNIKSNFAPYGESVTFCILDGFLLYWHPEVIAQIDVRLFMRAPKSVLGNRRVNRPVYYTADGVVSPDPPEYWDKIAWPEYVSAHKDIFTGEDIERGAPIERGESTGEPQETGGPVSRLFLVEDPVGDLAEMLRKAAEEILRFVRQPQD